MSFPPQSARAPEAFTLGGDGQRTLVAVLDQVVFSGLGNAMYLVRMPDRQPTMAARAFQQFLREAIVTAAPSWQAGAEEAGADLSS
ncbi:MULTISPECIES: hypothetical protein [Comamonas]|uniref:hypothetical protein n=1 Tax=Comamonas TaxID=283 RepID=UPI002111AF10|nr:MULTISPECIES: hypothetical protein [Comamonas]UUC93995.1 hypothetical protein NOX35_01135 [Comamonas sp. C11]WEE78043.1 hypothetical protein LZ683_01090 [Comamonas testosteroni]